MNAASAIDKFMEVINQLNQMELQDRLAISGWDQAKAVQ